MKSSVQDIKNDLDNGDGIMEPIVVAYDPNSGYAIVAEGNHRVEAAIQAKEEFVPVVVRTGNVSTKKDGEATPELVEKTSGSRFDAEMGQEVNPYFIFPDSDIPPISDPDVDLKQAQRSTSGKLSVEVTNTRENGSQDITVTWDGESYDVNTTAIEDVDDLRDLVYDILGGEGVSSKDIATELESLIDNNSSVGTKDVKSIQDRVKSVFDNLRSDLNATVPTRTKDLGPDQTPEVVFSESVEKNKKSIRSVLEAALAKLGKTAEVWSQNWLAVNMARSKNDFRAVNPATNKEFKSFNLIALSAAARENGFSDPRWMTADQAEKLGAKLNDGAVPTEVAVPHITNYTSENGVNMEVVEFETVSVYNAEQMSGLPAYDAPETPKYTFDEAIQLVLDRYQQGEIARGRKGIPPIYGEWMHYGETPAFSRTQGIESIRMPRREQYGSDEEYLTTLLHELFHSTGVRQRKNRAMSGEMDSREYAREEVVVQLAATALMQRLGLSSTLDNDAKYIKTWISDAAPDDVVGATADALDAIEFILGNDVLPEWNPSVTKRYVTETQARNDEHTPLTASFNSNTSQEAIQSLDLLEDISAKQATTSPVSSSKDAVNKVLESLKSALSGGFKNMPWRKPYKDGFEYVGGSGMPRNPATKRVYSGMNAFSLRLTAKMRGFEDSRWMTYNQAQDMGGQVRKGAKSAVILVPKTRKIYKNEDGSPIVTKDGEPGYKEYVYWSTANVFNVAEIDGLNLPDDTPTTANMTPLEAQEFIVERYKKSMSAKGMSSPMINYSYVGQYGDHFTSDKSPNWDPRIDVITLPQESQIESPEAWFETLMHELTHSTGHKARLDRSEITDNYATDPAARGLEELIAEMGAAILGEMFGVNYDRENMQAYIEGWQQAISETDLSSLQTASSMAQQAVDYLLGIDLGDWSPLEGYTMKSSVRPKKGE